MAASPQVPGTLETYRYLAGTNFEVGITAHSGGGQASAYQLSAQMSDISTVAAGADSVALPKVQLLSSGVSTPGSVGMLVFLSNHGANACQVYGVTPDIINEVATGTGISLPAGGVLIAWPTSYNATSGVGRWHAIVGADGVTPGPGNFTSLRASGGLFISGGSNPGVATSQIAITANDIIFVDATRTTNNKTVDLVWVGGQLLGRFINDANTSAIDWLVVTGGEAAGISSIIFGGPVVVASGSSLQLGSTYSAGVVSATGTIAIKDSTGTTYNVLVHT